MQWLPLSDVVLAVQLQESSTVSVTYLLGSSDSGSFLSRIKI